MICSISGKVAEFPVVSKNSGILFEKKSIERYILDHGKCPITGEPLTMDDILPIRTAKIPDSISAAVTLNACSSTAKESECQKMPDSIVRHIRLSFEGRQQRRRHRKISTSLTSIDALQKYILCDTHPLHKTNMPGTMSLDIDNSKEIIATGGADSNAVIYDNVSGIISVLEGHSKQVTSVKFVNKGELLVTGSADNTVRVWQRSDDGSYKCKHMLDHHTAEVQAVAIHPTHKYFVTASLDCTWKFYDLSSDSRVVACVKGSERFMTAAFHPDGHIIGTGTSRFVRFWDVSKQDDIVKIDAHTGTVSSITFSENGYHLATASEDSVKLWDLRFLRNFATFPSDDKNTHTRPVDFDHSGCYLATGGSRISVYNIASPSKCEIITTFPDYNGIANISSVKFGKDAKYLAAGSLDSKLLLLSSPPKEVDSMEF